MNYFGNVKWVALPLLLLLPLAAQDTKKSANKSKQSPMTVEQGEQIIEELREIRQLLQMQGEKGGPPAPTRAKLDLTGFQMLGSPSAPLTLVEFTDYQCPYCRQFHITTFADLKKTYIDTGKVRFYSRDLPLDAIHPNALRAAQAARCAIEQKQYWTLRDLMGANPDKLDLDHLVGFAASLKMDTNAFRTCVESQRYKEAVQNDLLEAMKIGAEATPTFVIGKSTPQGVDGELLVGAQPFTEFVKVISKLESK